MAGRDHFRAHARLGVDLWAVARCSDAGWHGDTRLLNLGLGGTCIETGEFLAPDLTIELEVQAPTLWDPLVLPSTVIWCAASDTGFHAGLRFDHCDPPALMALFELVDALAQQSRTPEEGAASTKAGSGNEYRIRSIR